MCFVLSFTLQQNFGGLKKNVWKQISKCKFWKTIRLLSPCKLQKCLFVKTMKSCTCVCMCSVYRYVRRHIVFLYKVTDYWPGMNNIAFWVILVVLYEKGTVWQCCRLYMKEKLCWCVNVPLLLCTCTKNQWWHAKCF